MIKNYNLFLSAVDSKIQNKAKLRVDLIGDTKISDIKELEGFNIVYIGNSYDDLVNIKGKLLKRKVRYIQIFKKEFN